MIVYVLEIADDTWEVEGVYKNKDIAEEAGRKIIESSVGVYEHYSVTAYLLG